MIITIVIHYFIASSGCNVTEKIHPKGLEQAKWLGDCEGNNFFFFIQKSSRASIYISKVFDVNGNMIDSGRFRLIQDRFNVTDSIVLRNNIYSYSSGEGFLLRPSDYRLVKAK